jgi:hypothetical protein
MQGRNQRGSLCDWSLFIYRIYLAWVLAIFGHFSTVGKIAGAK